MTVHNSPGKQRSHCPHPISYGWFPIPLRGIGLKVQSERGVAIIRHLAYIFQRSAYSQTADVARATSFSPASI